MKINLKDDGNNEQGFTEKSLATTERSEDVQTSFVVYPNPNAGTFNVKIDFPDFDGGTLEVYNLQGQLVDEFYVKDDSTITLKTSFESGTLLFTRLRNDYKYFGSSKIIIK